MNDIRRLGMRHGYGLLAIAAAFLVSGPDSHAQEIDADTSGAEAAGVLGIVDHGWPDPATEHPQAANGSLFRGAGRRLRRGGRLRARRALRREP